MWKQKKKKEILSDLSVAETSATCGFRSPQTHRQKLVQTVIQGSSPQISAVHKKRETC